MPWQELPAYLIAQVRIRTFIWTLLQPEVDSLRGGVAYRDVFFMCTCFFGGGDSTFVVDGKCLFKNSLPTS